MDNKARAGIACIVVGLGLAVGLPVVTGNLAEKAVKAELERLSATGGYRIESLEFDKGFASSVMAARLVGEGVRELSHEQIVVHGEIQHGSILSLPSMASAQLGIRIEQGEGEQLLSYTGQVDAELSWGGRQQVVVDMDAAVISFDEEAGIIAAIDGHTLRYDSASVVGGQGQVDVSEMSVLVSDPSAGSYRVDFTPAVVNWPLGGDAWTLSVPEARIYTESEQLMVTASELQLSGSDSIEDDLASSVFALSTGSVVLEGREQPLVKGVSLQVRVENISLTGVTRLVEAARVKDREAFAVAALEVLDRQPVYALDELNVNTGSGELNISLSFGASEGAGDAVRALMASSSGGVEDDLVLLQSFHGAAEFRVDNDLIVMGCRQGVEMAVPGMAGSEMAVEMCSGVVRSGYFINPACAPGDGKCLEKVSQIRSYWQQNGALKLAFDGQKVDVNGVRLELLEALVMFL